VYVLKGMEMGSECQQVGWDLTQVWEHGGQLCGMMAQNPQNDLEGTCNDLNVLVLPLVALDLDLDPV
jgi:hypothetical protein